MEKITGYIDHIIFRNEENGYTVFQFHNENGEVTCVGKFPYIGDGEFLELEGEYVMHPSYGLQLQVTEHKVKEPEDRESIERYLGSGAVKGIGPALAGKIVAKFGEDTFRIMEEEPERLAEIKGISERKAREICVQVEEKKDLRQAMIYLQKYGISINLAVKIYQKYGLGIYSILEENPYRLADDIEGVGFKTADEIAFRIGIHTDSDFRIQSGIFYTLLQSVQEGHVYLEEKVLSAKAAQLLEVEITDIEKYLMDLAMEKKVVLKQDEEQVRVYPAKYYYMEMNTARMLKELNIRYEEDDSLIRKRIEKLELSLFLKEWGEIASCVGFRTFDDLFRSSFCNHSSAFVSSFRPHINNIICCFDHIQIVFNDNDCISISRKSSENLGQLMDICKMKSCCRLVQNINGLSGTSFTQLGSKLDPLCFPSGKGGRRLAQTDIGKSHVVERLHLSADTRHIFKEGHRFFHCHIQHVVNALSFIFHFQCFPVITLSVTDFTRYIDIRQEMHLNLQDSIPAARLTASSFYIETEPALLVASRLCIRRCRKQVTDQVKHSCIRGRVGPRRTPDRRLVDINDFVKLLQP